MYETYKQWPRWTFIPLHHEFPVYIYMHREDAAAGRRENSTDVFGANTLLVQRRNALTFKHPEVVNRDRTHFSGVDARWITL